MTKMELPEEHKCSLTIEKFSNIMHHDNNLKWEKSHFLNEDQLFDKTEHLW